MSLTMKTAAIIRGNQTILPEIHLIVEKGKPLAIQSDIECLESFHALFLESSPRILLLTSIFTSRYTISRYNVFNQIEVVVHLHEALSSFLRLTPLSLQNYSNELDDTKLSYI